MSRHDGHQRAVTLTEWLSRLARWLELRAIALTPEHLHLEDGVRAAFIVALPLVLIIMTGQRQFGWAIFAAFWTCLADTGGLERRRRVLLSSFVVLGSVTALFASYMAGLGRVEALLAGPVLVALTALLPLRWPAVTMVATLLGVVAVVAAGYPHSASEAGMLALSFLGGGIWAAIVLTLVWRTDRWLPARQAVAAVYARLDDMAVDLSNARGDGLHERGDSRHGPHRRAVRSAIERAHARLDHVGEREAPTSTCLRGALGVADEIFHALLALDHLRLTRDGEAGEPAVMAAIPPLLASARRRILSGSRDQLEVHQQAVMLLQAVADRQGAAANAVRAIALALWRPGEATLSALGMPRGRTMPVARGGQQVIQTAIRSGVGVAFVTLVAHGLALNYPYWATMAVVVILQPLRRMSWSRGIERILGSVVGGVLALALMTTIGATWPQVAIVTVVAAATIALRSVNYTIFVVFLTLLFVLVMDLLHPGDGIASARIFDNLLGSLAAFLVTLLVWPDRGPTASALVAEAVAANRAYLDAVRLGDAEAIAAARRRAGLASTEAEVAIHAPDGVLGARPTASDIMFLMKSRRLAGKAAALWYERSDQSAWQDRN